MNNIGTSHYCTLGFPGVWFSSNLLQAPDGRNETSLQTRIRMQSPGAVPEDILFTARCPHQDEPSIPCLGCFAITQISRHQNIRNHSYSDTKPQNKHNKKHCHLNTKSKANNKQTWGSYELPPISTPAVPYEKTSNAAPPIGLSMATTKTTHNPNGLKT